MKKNKTLAFALAASLLVGGAALASTAWFTDQAVLNPKLSITMGTLDTDVRYDNEWEVTKGSENATLNADNLAVELSNAKPGDKIERNIYVTNEGSLTLDATVEMAKIDGLNTKLEYLGATDLDTTVNSTENGFAIKNLVSGKEKDVVFKMVIEVPTELEEQGKQIVFDGDLVTVKAEQQK